MSTATYNSSPENKKNMFFIAEKWFTESKFTFYQIIDFFYNSAGRLIFFGWKGIPTFWDKDAF